MLVEFIGAAGAGKSFLAEHVLARLTENGIAAHDFDRLEIRKSAPRNLALAAGAVILGLQSRQTSFACFRRAVAHLARYRIRRAMSDEASGIYLTSEGLFHRLITLHRNSRTLTMLDLATLIFRRTPVPDVVVIVESSGEIVFNRRTARNRSNDVFTRESVKKDLEMVDEARKVIEYVRTKSAPTMCVISVSAQEEGAHDAIETIARMLERNVDCQAA